MTRFPRRVIAAVILLVIIGNVWYLAHRSSGLGLSPVAEGSRQESESSKTPSFGSHKAGDTWDADAKDSTHFAAPVGNKGGNSDGSTADTDPDAYKHKPDAVQSSKPVEAVAGSPGSSGSKIDKSRAAYDKGMTAIKSTLDKIAGILPGVEPLRTYDRDIKTDTALDTSGELPATSYVMGMYLQLTSEEVAALQKSHRKMMNELPDAVVPNSFSGRGIVMTGGGKYFPMVLTAIKWLRNIDKVTPIEVFMADHSEYEAHICDGLFPTLNVECRVIKEIYGDKLSSKLESKYALKPLAILASKFDDIYFMDADSYPLTDINKVFDWEVYEETGLILNADYWPRYISPSYYDIVGIKLGGRARGNSQSDALLQSDRENAVPGRSTESGQVFVRKSAHIKSLMLAMYYNLYGPDVYFPLLMQNGHGEGDKDTYAAAAIVCGESYYQTQRRPVTLGYHREGDFKGYAMVQPDPLTDYSIFEEGKEIKEKFFALHANSIKSNPKYLLMGHEEPIRGAPPLRQQRYFGDMDNIKKELKEENDVEARLFRIMAEVACDWALRDGYVPLDWEDQSPERLCRVMKKHAEWLKTHPDVEAPVEAAYWIDLE